MLDGTFVTVTGVRNYNGVNPFSIGKMFLGQKEPSNPYDTEAIKVLDIGNIKVGYIANSTSTKLNGTMSAGRLYDRMGEFCFIEVCFSTKSEIICQILDFDCRDEDVIQKYTEDLYDKYDEDDDEDEDDEEEDLIY